MAKRTVSSPSNSTVSTIEPAEVDLLTDAEVEVDTRVAELAEANSTYVADIHTANTATDNTATDNTADASTDDTATDSAPVADTADKPSLFTPGPTVTRKAALVAALTEAITAGTLPIDADNAAAITATATALGSGATAVVDSTFATAMDPLIPQVADPAVLVQLQALLALKGAVNDLVAASKPGRNIAAPVDPLVEMAKRYAVMHAKHALTSRNIADDATEANVNLADAATKAYELFGDGSTIDFDSMTTLELADFIAKNSGKAKRSGGNGGTGVRTASGFDLARVPNGTRITYKNVWATVTDGAIVLEADGRSFGSPSGAAKAVNGGTETRGTTAWKDAAGTVLMDLMA
jgi:anti-sigma28 factor (negative regulator of flagellin synthesis)